MKRALPLFALVLAGCATTPTPVVVDSPRLATALIFLGVCAVVCSSIGGYSLITASRRRKD